MSILSPILKPLIKREAKKLMKDFIQPVLDFLFKLADKYGTKFIVALGGIGAMAYLAGYCALDPRWAVVGAVAIAVGYFFARRSQEKEQNAKETP